MLLSASASLLTLSALLANCTIEEAHAIDADASRLVERILARRALTAAGRSSSHSGARVDLRRLMRTADIEHRDARSRSLVAVGGTPYLRLHDVLSRDVPNLAAARIDPPAINTPQWGSWLRDLFQRGTQHAVAAVLKNPAMVSVAADGGSQSDSAVEPPSKRLKQTHPPPCKSSSSSSSSSPPALAASPAAGTGGAADGGGAAVEDVARGGACGIM